MKKIILVALGFGLSSGCLKTRNEVKDSEQKQVIQQQMVNLQKTNADVGSRFSDVDEQIRFLNGRVESLENKLSRGSQDTDKAQKMNSETLADMNKKMAIYQDSLSKMEAQIQVLQSELGRSRAEAAASVKEAQESAVKAKAQSQKGPYEAGQDLFGQKDWKAAIIEYQKYRDRYPKGKEFPDATYKIGVCFQELGMKEDAKVFYQEVVSRFPNSEEARRSKTRMKSLK